MVAESTVSLLVYQDYMNRIGQEQLINYGGESHRCRNVDGSGHFDPGFTSLSTGSNGTTPDGIRSWWKETEERAVRQKNYIARSMLQNRLYTGTSKDKKPPDNTKIQPEQLKGTP